MTDTQLLDRYRYPVGGAEGIPYVFALTPPGDQYADIDVVTRCEVATQIIEAGYRLGMLRTEPLLIIGGGAAGITAALVALSLGIDGITISNGDQFFQSQRECSHRFLHPRIYRWPESGCEEPEYVPPSAGLKWTAGYAAKVVNQWDPQTLVLVQDQRYSKIDPIPASTTVNSTENFSHLIFTDNSEQEWGMVLLCVAPSEEIDIGSFRGIRFWESDGLDEINCGCEAAQPKILICGAGDGAIQDLLRVSCPGVNIQKLHQLLELMFDQVRDTTPYDVRTHISKLTEIPSDQHERIHAASKEIVETILSTKEGIEAVSGFMDKAGGMISKERTMILTWPRNYFRKCYLLNRFLAVLVERWRDVMLEQKIFLPGVRLQKVEQNKEGYTVRFDNESCSFNNCSFDRVIPRLGIINVELTSADGILSVQRKPTDERA